jgi:hypothetical protein
MWKKDILRQDDSSKMRDMVNKLRKHRVNESGGANSQNGVGSKSKSMGARTSIQ